MSIAMGTSSPPSMKKENLNVEKRTYVLKSLSPGLLMHNGQLSDPLHPITREIKKVSGKRAKTDADHEEMARLEFLGSLYVNDQQEPVIPQTALRKMIIEAARKMKLGKSAEVGVYIIEEVVLQYDGPRDPNEMWKQGMYDRRQAGVNKASVMRTRPHFKNWSATLVVEYDPQFVDVEKLDEWLYIAGRQVGVLDFRPGRSGGMFGRFEVEIVE